MDWIGPREIIVLIGFLTILAIVLDVIRRVKRNRYEKLQMSSKVLNRNTIAADGFTDDLDQSQFLLKYFSKIWPPGGARPFVYFFVFPRFGHVPIRCSTIPLEGATR